MMNISNSKAAPLVTTTASHDVLVVGAGFCGAVIAEQLASRGMSVLVIDKRLHVAGTAHDVKDSNGVLIHPYGPHIFHTNNETVVDYLSGFTDWHPYEHRALAKTDSALVPTSPNTHAWTHHDDRYFTDIFQCMPREGYTKMFERILDHPLIDVEVGVDYFASRERWQTAHTVFTGPIDAYFGHCYGALPYRSIRFKHQHVPDTAALQPVGTIKYPEDFEFSRATEFKHLTGQVHSGTSIVREYPTDVGDPCFPIAQPQNEALYQRYAALAEQEEDVTFVGRLAEYRYYNMDQTVGAALQCAKNIALECA